MAKVIHAAQVRRTHGNTKWEVRQEQRAENYSGTDKWWSEDEFHGGRAAVARRRPLPKYDRATLAVLIVIPSE